MKMTESKPQRRWFYARPNWVLFALLAVEGFLLLSEQAGWFCFHQDADGTAAVAVAAVIVLIVPLLIMLWIVYKLAWLALLLSWSVARLAYRKRLQYSLRTLLVVITLFAILCSWLAVKIRQAQRQQVAVALIQKLGGSVVYEWPAGWKPARNVKPPPGPAWLRSLLGVELFEAVETIDLNGTVVTDDDVKQVQQALPYCKITR